MSNRKSFIDKEYGINARDGVEMFFDEISGCLVDNEQVKLSGFGNFDLYKPRNFLIIELAADPVNCCVAIAFTKD